MRETSAKALLGAFEDGKAVAPGPLPGPVYRYTRGCTGGLVSHSRRAVCAYPFGCLCLPLAHEAANVLGTQGTDLFVNERAVTVVGTLRVSTPL